jgi:hypothetical protein
MLEKNYLSHSVECFDKFVFLADVLQVLRLRSKNLRCEHPLSCRKRPYFTGYCRRGNLFFTWGNPLGLACGTAQV